MKAVVKGPLWYRGPVERCTPSFGIASKLAKPATSSRTDGCVATISLGRPVLPPDVGALYDDATAGGSASSDMLASGSKPAGTAVTPPASDASTPTTSDGLARSMIAARSADGS